ncbi:MAG: hypothetical protein EPN97_02325 [Alphaproteobacteria bacterium]|nr:MAG: hypothetical protein EPN97_02325 [Alphaproteobacteria bacterium]
MADAHIFVKDADGNSPKARWHTDEIYKVSGEVAKQLEAMKNKPEGRDLASWLRDHGGKLDDDGKKPARVSTKNDGTVLNDHYKDGEFLKGDVVRPKGAKADDRAGAHLLLALMTGGASLFVTPFMDDEAKEKGDGSKFTKTTPEEPATASTTKSAKTTVTSTTRPKPK